MAKLTPLNVVDQNGNTIIPVSDGIFYTKDYSTEAGGNHPSETGTFTIMFCDAGGDPVTPTAGTFLPVGRSVPILNGNGRSQFQAGTSGGAAVTPIDANTVIAEQDGYATYVQPVFAGSLSQGAVILDSVAGATHFVATFWRV